MSVESIVAGKRQYRELALEPPSDSIPGPLPVPEGMRAWENRKNGFTVVACHYSADPEKRNDDWYTAACKNLREDQIERELEINFDSKAGAKAFPFLEHHESHFRADPPYPIPAHWKIIVGLDYGSRNPTSVHWYAIDESRRFWAFDEFYCPMQDLPGGIASFASYLKNHAYYSRARHIVADPSIFNKSQNVLETKETGRESWGTLMSIADILQKNCGITKLQRANNDRIAGLTRVHQMLNWRGDRIAGLPNLYVGRRCQKLWWELTNLVYKFDDKPDKNATEDVVKRNDHCFVAGTMISTPGGPVAIEHIKEGDYVLTRMGARPVARAGCSGVTNTFTLIFSNGSKVTCTGDHPIFTKNKGFVNADELSYEDECVQEKKGKRFYLTGVPFVAIRWLARQACETTLGAIQSAQNAAFDFFIGRSGHITMAQSLSATTSITLTETRSTMSRETWSAYPRERTSKSIAKKFLGLKNYQKAFSTLVEFVRLRKSGTPRQRDLSLIVGSLRIRGKTEERSKKRAWNAGLNFSPSGSLLQGLCFAILSAARRIGGTPALTILRPLAGAAARVLRKAAILALRHVRGNAVYLCARTADKIQSPVYNLTVSEIHEYFANGMLVKNCFDELKYALLSQDLPAESPGRDPRIGKTTLKDIEDEIDLAYASENASSDDEHFLNIDESFVEDMDAYSY